MNLDSGVPSSALPEHPEYVAITDCTNPEESLGINPSDSWVEVQSRTYCGGPAFLDAAGARQAAAALTQWAQWRDAQASGSGSIVQPAPALTLEDLARDFVEMFKSVGLNGIADEMRWSDIELGNKFWTTYKQAQRLTKQGAS